MICTTHRVFPAPQSSQEENNPLLFWVAATVYCFNTCPCRINRSPQSASMTGPALADKWWLGGSSLLLNLFPKNVWVWPHKVFTWKALLYNLALLSGTTANKKEIYDIAKNHREWKKVFVFYTLEKIARTRGKIKVKNNLKLFFHCRCPNSVNKEVTSLKPGIQVATRCCLTADDHFIFWPISWLSLCSAGWDRLKASSLGK